MFNRCHLCFAAALALMVGFAQSASAVQLNFSFQLNSVGDKPLFMYDNAGTDSIADDSFHVTAGTTEVDLVAERDGGGAVLFEGIDRAEFSLMTTSVNSVSFVPDLNRFVFDLAGEFAFNENDGGPTILAGSFDSAKLNIRAIDVGDGKYVLAAGETFFDFSTMGSLYTTAGPSLDPLFGPGEVLGGFQTMHFTMNGLSESDPNADIGSAITVMENVDLQTFDVLDSFVFDSSYSGVSDLIPEPASALLALMGLSAIAFRRKA